jgi:hypothetical protein
MNTLPTLPLNEIYRHYLDVYFHASQLSEPRLTRSEFERALNLLPVEPVNVDDAESWLNCFSPAWLRGEPEAEPFPENTEANRQWRETQRTQREQRETVLRKRVTRSEATSLLQNE